MNDSADPNDDPLDPEEDDGEELDDHSFVAGHGTRWAAAVVVLGALVGAYFAAVSTSDFVRHLDRQVHAIHCSLVPGGGLELGDSGCRTVMMSPYSSFFREHLWGGLPVALWALAVFAFLAYRAVQLVGVKRAERPDTGFLLAATLLPCGMSVLYGYLAAQEVGVMCTVCVGIYVGSAVCFAGALWAWLSSEPSFRPRGPQTFAIGFGEGVAFVVLLTVVYLGLSPAADPDRARKGCGTLVEQEDRAKAMLHLAPASGGVPAIDVLDPLCPACRAFEDRLQASGLAGRLDRRTVLFPLDSTCNWMVQTSLHPGACAVSEAMLCADGLAGRRGDPAEARRILQWAFAHQEELLAAAKADERAFRRRLVAEFPAVAGCVGGARARNRVTKGLRWAVANALPVLTPQLFVDGARLCGEDTDLGLEYTLTQMTAAAGGRGRP